MSEALAEWLKTRVRCLNWILSMLQTFCDLREVIPGETPLSKCGHQMPDYLRFLSQWVEPWVTHWVRCSLFVLYFKAGNHIWSNASHLAAKVIKLTHLPQARQARRSLAFLGKGPPNQTNTLLQWRQGLPAVCARRGLLWELGDMLGMVKLRLLANCFWLAEHFTFLGKHSKDKHYCNANACLCGWGGTCPKPGHGESTWISEGFL